jgi:hypothetical protein
VSLYVDTSALLKRYVEEPESSKCENYMLSDPTWISARHTWVEVRRNLSRLLRAPELFKARDAFTRDWDRVNVVELDETTCAMAADVAELTLARTLDALHLAALRRVGGAEVALLTFDLQQARIARELGFTVLGA